jgi:hypothetical protein
MVDEDDHLVKNSQFTSSMKCFSDEEESKKRENIKI